MVAYRSHQFEGGDRFFVTITERSRKFHGTGCVWFRPDDNATAPYRASVYVAKEVRPRVFEATVRAEPRWFSRWQDAEKWTAIEYINLRKNMGTSK